VWIYNGLEFQIEVVHTDVIPPFHYYECYSATGQKSGAKICFDVEPAEGILSFLFPPLVLRQWYKDLSVSEGMEDTGLTSGGSAGKRSGSEHLPLEQGTLGNLGGIVRIGSVCQLRFFLQR
jgi:hypothetical protein